MLGAWVTAFVLVTVTSGAIGNGFRDEFNMPDVESREGLDVLEADFEGQGTGITGTIVFRAEQGVDDPAVRTAMEEVFARVSEVPEVTSLSSPYGPDGERFVASEGPAAGTIAYAEVEMDEDMPFERGGEIAELIRDAQAPVEGLQVELGGFIFAFSPAGCYTAIAVFWLCGGILNGALPTLLRDTPAPAS